MVFATVTDQGEILGALHATKESAMAAAITAASRLNQIIRVVHYGDAGEVKSFSFVNKTGWIGE